MVVMIVRYMQIDKLTGSTLAFGKILLSASYNILLTSVLTSMYNPRALALSAVSPCVENDMQEVKEDAKEQEENLYPAMNTVKLPLSQILLISSV